MIDKCSESTIEFQLAWCRFRCAIEPQKQSGIEQWLISLTGTDRLALSTRLIVETKDLNDRLWGKIVTIVELFDYWNFRFGLSQLGWVNNITRMFNFCFTNHIDCFLDYSAIEILLILIDPILCKLQTMVQKSSFPWHFSLILICSGCFTIILGYPQILIKSLFTIF